MGPPGLCFLRLTNDQKESKIGIFGSDRKEIWLDLRFTKTIKVKNEQVQGTNVKRRMFMVQGNLT